MNTALRPDPIQWWRRSVDLFLESSKDLNTTLNENLKHAPTIWASPSGQNVLSKLSEAWSLTSSVWTLSKKRWDAATLLENSLCLGSFLDALTNDYLYRTNAALPSGPLWNHLESAFDAPAMCQALCRSLQLKHAHDTTMFHSIYENMIFLALGRPQVEYTLLGKETYPNIWASVSRLGTFWSLEPSPADAQHGSLLRCYDLLPDQDALLAYANKYRLPTPTIEHMLGSNSPMANLHQKPTALWFQWLSSMQTDPVHWSLVQTRVPEMAELVQLVSLLEDAKHVGATAYQAYQQKKSPTLGSDVNGLFVDNELSNP